MTHSDDEINRQVEKFFARPPKAGPGRIGEEKSLLFLLRRDLRDLSVPEGDAPDTQELRAPVLAALGIMIGFEILARIYQGSGLLGNPAKADAFRKFLDVSDAESWLMVYFRDAVAHGYQLTAHTRDKGTFHFALAPGRPDDSIFTPVRSSIRASGPNSIRHEVNFWALRQRFLTAVEQFQQSLANTGNASARARFVAALPKLQPYVFI